MKHEAWTTGAMGVQAVVVWGEEPTLYLESVGYLLLELSQLCFAYHFPYLRMLVYKNYLLGNPRSHISHF